MTHFAVMAPPLAGHYLPLSHLATRLIDRGHRVTFVHQEEARTLVKAPGAEFAAIGAGARSVDSWTGPMARIQGLFGLGETIRRMDAFTTMFCREGPALLKQLGIDAIIADQLEPAGGLVAEHLGIPWISVAVTVPMNREPSVPPPFVGWRFDGSEAGRERNRGGWRVSDFMLRRFNAAIARNARWLDLPPRRRLEDCLSPSLQIAQLVGGLDFPRRELPQGSHYVGPFRAAAPDPFTLPPGDGRPTVFCTLGTLQGSRIALFRRVARACDGLGLRLVLTHGGRGARNLASRLAGDPLVYDWVPQEAVVGQVDLVVCHGGANAVLDPLAAGVPLVVMPLAFEQAGIAARVAFSGAGKILGSRSSSVAIGQAIRQVLDAPAYRERARVLGREIGAAGGADRAADLIEALLGVPRAAATTAGSAQGDARGDSRSGSSSAANRAS
jgi:zeaxanthin glucosyltransferase